MRRGGVAIRIRILAPAPILRPQMDRALLLTTRGLRAFGFGFSAVLLGIHLEQRGMPAGLIGLTIGVGLAAASISGLVAAWLAARFGRRATLALCGVLMALAGLDLAAATTTAALVASALTGMLGAASVDLGPFAAVEQSMLAETVSGRARNLAFGRYSLIAGLLNAAGGAAAGLAVPGGGSSFYYAYALIGGVTVVLPLLMSTRVESSESPIAFGRFRPLALLAGLFALDSLGGGFVANGVIAYWLHVR